MFRASPPPARPPSNPHVPPPPERPPPKPSFDPGDPKACLKSVADKVEQPVSGVTGAGDGRRVQLLTFGLESFDQDLYDMCCRSFGGGACARIPNDTLHRALRRKDLKVDVFVDARNFPDPECRTLTRHTGHNHEIIARLVGHRNFQSWLGSVKVDFHQACAQGGNAGSDLQLTIAVYCRAGKHRSVAGAIVLQHILTQEGWECPMPRHLSQSRWSKACCKGNCQDCRYPPPSHKDVLDRAFDIWRNCSAESAWHRGGHRRGGYYR